EVDRLREIDVAVVVALDEQYGRFPAAHGRDRRGIEGDLHGLVDVALFVALRLLVEELRDVAGPVVDAVEVDSGLEDVGVAGEPHRGEIAAVGASPDADLR